MDRASGWEALRHAVAAALSPAQPAYAGLPGTMLAEAATSGPQHDARPARPRLRQVEGGAGTADGGLPDDRDLAT
ncbi:MAG TPA: hypothetical protein VF728_05960, partial [Nocardioides sp.]